jgi:hypothetical protein
MRAPRGDWWMSTLTERKVRAAYSGYFSKNRASISRLAVLKAGP